MITSTLLALVLSNPVAGDVPRAGVAPPEKLRAFYQQAMKQRLEARRPPPPEAPPLVALERTIVARVEGWADEAVHVSRAVSPEMQAILVKRGVPVVPKNEVIGGDALQSGRYHRVIRVGPRLRGAGGEALFERLSGQDVRLSLGRAADAHVEVVEVREAGPNP